MNSIAASAEKIDAICLRARRADLADVAVEVLGLSESTATHMSLDDLTARFSVDGFDEEGLLQDLVDNRGYHPMGVNELCLSSMISLWIESIQPEHIKTKSIKKTRVAREQDASVVGAWQHKYAMPGQGPRDIVFGMIQAGQFTKQQIRAAVLEAFPTIKGSYLNTMMARTTNEKTPAFKQLACVNENGILSWIM